MPLLTDVIPNRAPSPVRNLLVLCLEFRHSCPSPLPLILTLILTLIVWSGHSARLPLTLLLIWTEEHGFQKLLKDSRMRPAPWKSGASSAA